MSCVDQLRTAAYDILEDGLFLFIDELPTLPGDTSDVSYTIHVGEHEVGLQLGEDSARALAAHMLGRDQDGVTADETGAAVAEALNMLVGRFVVDVVGADVELDFGLPERGGAPSGDVLAFHVEEAGDLVVWYHA